MLKSNRNSVQEIKSLGLPKEEENRELNALNMFDSLLRAENFAVKAGLKQIASRILETSEYISDLLSNDLNRDWACIDLAVETDF